LAVAVVVDVEEDVLDELGELVAAGAFESLDFESLDFESPPFESLPFESLPDPSPDEPDDPPSDPPFDFEPDGEDVAERSFLAQPEPLKWIVGALKPLRIVPTAPQFGQVVGPAS
jgi:hypothetical protein